MLNTKRRGLHILGHNIIKPLETSPTYFHSQKFESFRLHNERGEKNEWNQITDVMILGVVH